MMSIIYSVEEWEKLLAMRIKGLMFFVKRCYVKFHQRGNLFVSNTKVLRSHQNKVPII